MSSVCIDSTVNLCVGPTATLEKLAHFGAYYLDSQGAVCDSLRPVADLASEALQAVAARDRRLLTLDSP